MSPLTALFLGLSLFGVSLVAMIAVVALYGLKIADDKSDRLLGLADNTVERVPEIIRSVTDQMPELIKSLPPVLSDAFNDRRAPEYTGQLVIQAELRPSGRRDSLAPVVTIENKGSEMVSLLSVRVAVLDESGTPRREYTEMAATPLAIDHDWRGPLMPGATRHLVLCDWDGLPQNAASRWKAVCEISELRLWNGPAAEAVASNN